MKNETAARWMVVDDDADTLDAVASLLAAVSDAEICRFPSPWQALDAFAAAPESFHLVITDYQMPGMNGLDFRQHLQTVSPAAKVLLATGSGLFTDESAREHGFCGLLCKPFSIGTLKEILTTVQVGTINF